MGDLVILTEDEDFLKEQILNLLKDEEKKSFKEEKLRPMLGKKFTVLPSESERFDEKRGWVRLIDDDGKKWYFPKTTLRKVETSKWT